MKLVLCRRDLPSNPKWIEENYPYENCWDVDEFFATAVKHGEESQLWREARRIFWESYWRMLGRYRGGKPFFESYLVVDSRVEPAPGGEKWILGNIIASALSNGLVPPEAKSTALRVYREIFGSLTE